ncbi:MAG TPA: Rad52/Rad22 family DNA repair protein [Gemmatimonadaceae bacterium]|nr:Rad52/Rad22 family DNA repair protein [Gemmatimonadaceae bacterium]
MIARHETHLDKTDIWSKLAAPLPAGVISWRQDGKPISRDGKYFARFVAYIEANTVRERLDSVVPGEWDLTLELLPPIPGAGDDEPQSCSFKARLQILGVIREDVGTGRDYKSAATDAFKRAAVRFGIAHELYAYEQNWVQVDSESKYAKPLEEPQSAYNRRYAGRTGVVGVKEIGAPPAAVATAPSAQAADAEVEAPMLTVTKLSDSAASAEEIPSCPKCDGRMWDNRSTKRNPKAPDFKCRDRSCDGVIWPPKAAPATGRSTTRTEKAAAAEREPEIVLDSSPLATGTDDIPF